MQLHDLKKSVLPIFLSSIHSIVDHHFADMIQKDDICKHYYVNNEAKITASLFRLIELGVVSLFLAAHEFEFFKEKLEEESYREGKDDALKQNVINNVVLESNHNLRYHIFNDLLPVIDSVIAEPEIKYLIINRMNETASLRFKSYYLGYISVKDQQINSLHQQKLAMMGQMSAGMAHEIRNPLTSIKGFLDFIKELLDKDRLDRDTFNHYIDICKTELLTIERLVSDFLILARKSELLNKELVPLDINNILIRVYELSKHHAIEKSITLCFHYHESHTLALGVSSYIEQISLNIIKNGIDASPVNGIFEVRTEVDLDEKLLVIRFSDNGCGIPQENVEKIFEPFFTTKETGTGMGLAICKKLILDMKGSIHVESAVDKGTTFEVRLALA